MVCESGVQRLKFTTKKLKLDNMLLGNMLLVAGNMLPSVNAA